jgi:hypothetical protein
LKINFLKIFLAFLFLFPFLSKAQEDNLGLVIGDLLKVTGDFVKPAGKATVYQSDAGWFSSAQSLGLWKIDVSIHGNALFVPGGKTTTTVSNSDFEVIHIRGAETAEVPTAFGGDTDVFFDGEIAAYGNTTEFEFQALEGLGKQVVIHPFVQVAVGLPLEIEFSIRYVPIVNIDDVEILTFGVGLKHNLNQYFQNSEPEDFQFAVLLAYSKFNVDYKFEPLDINGLAEFDALKVKSDLWSLQLISSKVFPNSPWEVSAALGITNADFDYALGGTGPALDGLNQALETIGDNEITVKGHLGGNYKIGRFSINSMIAIGEFYNLSLGVCYGFGIR